MSDLVERLHAMSRHEHDDLSIGDEAADEIKRLTALTETLHADQARARALWTEEANARDAEIERLRAECLRLSHAEAEAMSVVLSLEGQVERLRELLRKAGAAIHYHRREHGYDKSKLESGIDAALGGEGR